MKELKNPAGTKSRIADKKRKKRSEKDASFFVPGVSAKPSKTPEPRIIETIAAPTGNIAGNPTENRTGETFTDGAVRNALIKKATGYVSEETVTEYSFGDGIETPVKKKVTKKEVPPDITAIKMLLGESSENTSPDYRDYSDEELIAEKNRLIGLLKTESD